MSKFDLGPAVKDGVLRYVSVSQIESFDPSCYGGCNRRWWFRRVARDKEDQGKSAALGEQLHLQIEHYLRNGDKSVLGDIVLAGFRFIPTPGPDLKLEWEFGQKFGEQVLSPLNLADVPLIGKADCGHARGEWLDDDGNVNPEPGGVEIVDWKTTKRIDDECDRDGVVKYQGLAKDANTLANTHQMRAYAALAVVQWPQAEWVRLSHGYFQTKWPRLASKRSKRVDAAGAMGRFLASTPLVEKMKLVAQAEKVTDVDPNTDACGAFGGCPHRDKCPRSAKVMLSNYANVRPNENRGEKLVSLLSKKKPVVDEAPTPSVKPEVAVEMERLRAEEGASIAPPDVPEGKDIAAVPAAAIVATGGEAGGPCATGGQQVKVGDTKAYTCGCGAIVRVRPKKLADGEFYALVPSHTVGEQAAPKKAKAKAAPEAAVEPESLDLFEPTEAAEIKNTGTIKLALYLDSAPDHRFPVQRLEEFADALAMDLAATYGAVDIRCAPEKSPLAFGKWAGALAAAVRENKPEVGLWAVSSTSEFGMIAFNALVPFAGMIVRPWK